MPRKPCANICTQWTTTPALQAFAQPIGCGICDHLAKSHQAHTVHMFSKHSVKSDMRRYFPHTYCPVCLRDFGQRELCLNHVRYRSMVCRNNLLIRGPCLSKEEADALDNECKPRNRHLHVTGCRRHHVETPSFCLPGALLPILLAPDKFSAHHPLGRGHRYT